ncbi:MAG: RDD family protein [Candidatus Baltobacteraceae bacterium]
MERTLDVRTPESVAFSYELAGIGSRFLAVAIDFVAQIGILALVFWGLYLISRGAPPAPHLPAGERFWSNVGVAIVIAIVFFVFFGYFIAFEALWNGQTPGKRAMGLRVVRDGGYPIDFTSSLVRNLVRVGEAALGTYAIAGIVAVLSPENKRIGDIAAGTIVVRDARMSGGRSTLDALSAQPQYASTAYLSGEERALVKRFLERRFALEGARRRALAAQIAGRVRSRLPAEMANLDDESLLERL